MAGIEFGALLTSLRLTLTGAVASLSVLIPKLLRRTPGLRGVSWLDQVTRLRSGGAWIRTRGFRFQILGLLWSHHTDSCRGARKPCYSKRVWQSHFTSTSRELVRNAES